MVSPGRHHPVRSIKGCCRDILLMSRPPFLIRGRENAYARSGVVEGGESAGASGGDVFIQAGYPGHAVIVVDVAKDRQGHKVFLLAQSYMPAQDMQILRNPELRALGPWYDANFGAILRTPEWTF